MAVVEVCEEMGIGFVPYFFFSSRRRHTRFDCDWSSDVCSSDLETSISESTPKPTSAMDPASHPATIEIRPSAEFHTTVRYSRLRPRRTACSRAYTARSEERRVGEEWRWRWSKYVKRWG